jgi:hypothetical protein
MATIRRHDPNAFIEVEVPEGHMVCEYCKGEGYLSGYDEGWHSLMHSPELAAKKECFMCGGDGYTYDFSQDLP